jgi:hypothetical protein
MEAERQELSKARVEIKPKRRKYKRTYISEII